MGGRSIFRVSCRGLGNNLNKDDVEFHLYLRWKEPCCGTELAIKHWFKRLKIRDILETGPGWIYEVCSPLKTNLTGGFLSLKMDMLAYKIKEKILRVRREGYGDNAILVKTVITVTVLNLAAKEVNAIRFGEDEMKLQQMDCAICLEAFQEGSILAQLQHCSHTFHFLCIDKWWFRDGFTDEGIDCPYCRQWAPISNDV